MPDEIVDAIEDAAGEPLEVEVDGQRVKGRTIADLIKADQYLDAKTASGSASRGLRFTRLINPGAV